MADDADIASSYIDDQITRALGKLHQNQNDAAKKVGSRTCSECGDKIPEARRKLGFKFCVECAEEMERRKSLFADY